MLPQKTNVTLPKSGESNGDEDSTVLDHLCGQAEGPFVNTESSLSTNNEGEESSEPDVSLNQAYGSWVPDLTLRYPPTFSDKVCC
jgi:hypothetical protein